MGYHNNLMSLQCNIEVEGSSKFCQGNYVHSQRIAFSSWCIANIAVKVDLATWQKVQDLLCRRVICDHFPIKLFKSGCNVQKHA